MNNFLQRSLTGILFVSLVAGAIMAGRVYFSILFLLISLIGLWEFYKISQAGEASPQKIPGLLTGALFYFFITDKPSDLLHSIIDNNYYYSAISVIPVLFIFSIELFRKKEKPFLNIAYTLLGIIYTAVPFALLNLIGSRGFDDGWSAEVLFGFFILQWTSDTGAYLSGRAFGKHKLFERISPKKTWEGFAGGTLLTLAIAYVLSLYFDTLSLNNWMAMALIIAITGTLGDLTESMLKRSAGIKDSGSILPGHGGVLDRFDGVLFSAPAVWVFLHYL